MVAPQLAVITERSRAAADPEIPFRPQPNSVEETGIDFGQLLDLCIKTIYYGGRPSARDVSAQHGSALHVVEIDAHLPQAGAVHRGRWLCRHRRAAVPVRALRQGPGKGRGGAGAQPVRRPSARPLRGVRRGRARAVGRKIRVDADVVEGALSRPRPQRYHTQPCRPGGQLRPLDSSLRRPRQRQELHRQGDRQDAAGTNPDPPRHRHQRPDRSGVRPASPQGGRRRP